MSMNPQIVEEELSKLDSIPFPHENTCVFATTEVSYMQCSCQRKTYIELCKNYLRHSLLTSYQQGIEEGIKKSNSGRRMYQQGVKDAIASLPEKKGEKDGYDLRSNCDNNYVIGWNACIDEMNKRREE